MRNVKFRNFSDLIINIYSINNTYKYNSYALRRRKNKTYREIKDWCGEEEEEDGPCLYCNYRHCVGHHRSGFCCGVVLLEATYQMVCA